MTLENTSGIEPVEFNCVFLPEKVEEKTASGIFLPEQHTEREQHASVQGVMVAASPLAFTYETWPEGVRPPQPGDKVLIAKYAGTMVTGTDGQDYRIIKDKDILAVRTG